MLFREYSKLTGISMVYAFTVALVLPILAPYLSSLGYSAAAISIIFAIFPLVTIVISLWLANLAKAYGRYYLILLSLLVEIVAFWLYITATPLSIVVARILDAVCFAVISTLLFAKVEDSLDTKNRGKYAGIVLSLQYVVRLGGPIVGGVIADRAIQAPFVLSILLFATLAFLLRKSHCHKEKLELKPTQSFKWFFSNARLRPFLILGPAMNATTAAFTVFLPLLIVKEFGLSLASVGGAIAVFGAAHLLQFFFGDLSDKYGRWKFIIAGCAIYGAFMLLIASVKGFNTLLVYLAVAGIGVAVWNIVAWSEMSDVAAAEGEQTAVVSLYGAVSSVGEFAGFIIASVLAVSGYRSVFFILGLVALAGTLIAGLFALKNSVSA